ncbi:hypothetical protein LWE61_16730 [Sphingobium sufflavum]|nr:hypothetical protein [Sphingobium sufflavum]MCE7798187.1 hypothetical protein [Sphingobium sufflavum]
MPHSHVLEILFPGETIETPQGPVNALVGKGIAKIFVGEATIPGMPLC